MPHHHSCLSSHLFPSPPTPQTPHIHTHRVNHDHQHLQEEEVHRGRCVLRRAERGTCGDGWDCIEEGRRGRKEGGGSALIERATLRGTDDKHTPAVEARTLPLRTLAAWPDEEAACLGGEEGREGGRRQWKMEGGRTVMLGAARSCCRSSMAPTSASIAWRISQAARRRRLGKELVGLERL